MARTDELDGAARNPTAALVVVTSRTPVRKTRRRVTFVFYCVSRKALQCLRIRWEPQGSPQVRGGSPCDSCPQVLAAMEWRRLSGRHRRRRDRDRIPHGEPGRKHPGRHFARRSRRSGAPASVSTGTRICPSEPWSPRSRTVQAPVVPKVRRRGCRLRGVPTQGRGGNRRWQPRRKSASQQTWSRPSQGQNAGSNPVGATTVRPVVPLRFRDLRPVMTSHVEGP